jgi:hypothetical protein
MRVMNSARKKMRRPIRGAASGFWLAPSRDYGTRLFRRAVVAVCFGEVPSCLTFSENSIAE